MGCCHSKAVVSMRVQERHSGRMIDETIPSYLRSVYRVMYQNPVGRKLIKFPVTTAILRRATAQHGLKMDHPDSANQIAKFIETYGVIVEEVELPLSSYTTFNDFFARRLKPGARPIACPDDPSVIVSPADCRLLVFPSVEDTTRLWLKGQNFTVASLLGPQFQHMLKHFHAPALAIARLAPQDYHRWHMPVDSVVGPRGSVDGTYFSVSPRAVREVNILCTNKREVCFFDSGRPGTGPGAIGKWCMIAVGAAMVSSIHVNEEMQEGVEVEKGAEHGAFRFGGSTLILLFDAKNIAWDDDLVEASRKPIETYVRMGTQIARTRSVRREEQRAAAAAHRPRPLDAASFGAAAGGQVVPLLSPSPSPVSARLVHTATTDAGRKEAALNDEGLLQDIPVLQSNLTLMSREGDTVAAKGVPHTTDASEDAAEAVNADLPLRYGAGSSVGESLEAFLPSFLTGSSAPESPGVDHEHDHDESSSSGEMESPSHRHLLQESRARAGRSQSPYQSSAASAPGAAASGARGGRGVRLDSEEPVRAPAPPVFQLMHFTADEESSSASSSSSDGDDEQEQDEEMGAAGGEYQQEERKESGSSRKKRQQQPQQGYSSSAAAAAGSPAPAAASARQSGRRRSRAAASSNKKSGRTSSSRMEDVPRGGATSSDGEQEDATQEDDEERQQPAKKKKKQPARSRK